MILKGKRIAFLGDSITEGVGASSNDTCYVERVKQRAELAEALNYGISGTRFAKQIAVSEPASHDLDFVSRVDEMDKSVDAVVVFGGTNDFGHGDAPFGSFADTSYDSFCGACDELMRRLVERYSDIPIVFMTPLHRLTEDYPINEIGITRKVLSDYVDAIRRKAEKYSIPVLDLYKESGMQPNIEAQNKLYFADGLHPNDVGHDRIAALVVDYLQKLV